MVMDFRSAAHSHHCGDQPVAIQRFADSVDSIRLVYAACLLDKLAHELTHLSDAALERSVR